VRRLDRSSSRSRPETTDLATAWEENAALWIAWARADGHDSYHRFHRDLFFDLLPPPGRATLDLGCGEGRVAADLTGLGHAVVGVDLAPSMVAAARAAHPRIRFEEADAASLPFADESFDCVVAFMSLHDMDDFDQAVREAARVLEAGGRLCIAVVHPLNSAGQFTGDEADAPFVIEGSYLASARYEDVQRRDGLEMRFVSVHRPLADYCAALRDAGLLIEELRETPRLDGIPDLPERSRRWLRVPLFLHLRALKPN
jgi:SAM-dependent methyltransferase